MRLTLAAFCIAVAGFTPSLGAQAATPAAIPKGEALQVVDTLFEPRLRNRRAFAAGKGPLVVVDAGHHNFHTAAGRYRPFARLAEADGFRVVGNRDRLDSASLAPARILVIANALNARNERQGDWRLPTPSAFDATEIVIIAAWVRRGGALLLIADHLPFSGAATELAEAFGVHFANGYALLGKADEDTGDYPIVFRRSDGSLRANPVTDGRGPTERIDSLESFTGSAFRVTGTAGAGVMVLPAGTRVLMPVAAWKFSDSTAAMSGEGMLQGAAFRFGRGRVAVFGEAAMFSAQRKGVHQAAMGMNAPAASQNPQFVLNVLHWLGDVR